MALPWFSSKGQVVQTACAVFSATILAINQWPTFKDSEYLAAGALAVYFAGAVAIVSVVGVRKSVPSDWLRAALWLSTAAALGAASWAYFVAPTGNDIKIVGYNIVPPTVGEQVAINPILFSSDPASVVGISTIRYVEDVPESIYERRGLESGIWEDFMSKPPSGPEVAISLPPGQPVTVEQKSEKPASEGVIERLSGHHAAVYLMGYYHRVGSRRQRQYCVYALYNPPRLGICVEHNS